MMEEKGVVSKANRVGKRGVVRLILSRFVIFCLYFVSKLRC